MEVLLPLLSVTVIDAVPPPTGVTVKLACVDCVCLKLLCVVLADEVVCETVATLVFVEAALNVPL
jgi:hypothetical protein